MILLDSDVLLLEQRYKKDPRFAVNQQTLQVIQALGIPLGITTQALLEVVGNLSFNVAPADISKLPGFLLGYYRLRVVEILL